MLTHPRPTADGGVLEADCVNPLAGLAKVFLGLARRDCFSDVEEKSNFFSPWQIPNRYILCKTIWQHCSKRQIDTVYQRLFRTTQNLLNTTQLFF